MKTWCLNLSCFKDAFLPLSPKFRTQRLWMSLFTTISITTPAQLSIMAPLSIEGLDHNH